MFFQQRINEDASISYFFGCGGLGKAIAVDVLAGDEAWFLDQARRLNADILLVIDTHVHADHVSGGRQLAALSGAEYALHEHNLGRSGFPFRPLSDGELIEAGNTQVEVLHTPGHTDDSICLLVTDRRRGDAPWFVLTGDTLFVGSVGRPDLAGREREMARQLWDSVHARLLTLPSELEVYPGHTAGSPCGAAISGKPATTIGFERRWKPLLAVGPEEFSAQLLNTIPVRPASMDHIVALNLGQAGG